MNDYIKQFEGRATVMRSRGRGITVVAERGKALSLEQIAEHVPSIFADEKHVSRSERYEFLDTREVLGGMIAEGFLPVEVRQGGSRDEAKLGFTKHMIRFTTPGDHMAVEPRVGDITRPNIILRNAHDGTSSYQLNVGLLRLVCLNGMESNDEFSTFRVGHTRNARDKVIDAAFKVVQDVPRIIDQVRTFAGLQLTNHEQIAFAEAARELRWEPEDRTPPVTPVQLLEARRHVDAGADLWRTMNRVQENLIRGGQRYRTVQVVEIEGRQERRTVNRTVGQVNSIDQDSKINRALWTLTRKMEELKQAA